MAEKVLEVNQIKANIEEKEILHGVDLSVGAGEVHVLMGPNGTGKSTLGAALMGNPAYTVTGGDIIYKGQNINEMPDNERAKNGIFLSFQNPIEIPGITVSAFIRSALEAKTGKRVRLFSFKKELEEKGLKSIIVFGVPLPESKDEVASPDYSSTGIVQRAIRELKKQTDLVVIGDVCLCQYTSHGHCGLIKENDDTDDGVEILNDESLEYLAKVAVSYAKAGVDIVAPSDMMDGRVDAIRTALDENGFYNVMIMSYSAKYASAFYEPFRAAADSSPTHGNRKSYQMDPANALEAIRECELDVIEGADFFNG